MEARSLAPHATPLIRLGVSVALATCAMLILVAGLFLLRRLSGAITVGLDAVPFLACGAALVAVAAAPRLAGWRLTPAYYDRRLRLALLVLPAIAVVMFAASLTFPTTHVWPLVLIWTIIAVEEGAWWVLYYRTRRPRLASGPVPRREAASAVSVQTALEAESDPVLIASNVVQEITRVREPDGVESISGVLRGDFAPGERTQDLHLAFCPPLAQAPEFTFEQVEGPPAAVKAAQVESFGVRLEVRLSAALDEPASVLVEFAARTASVGRPT